MMFSRSFQVASVSATFTGFKSYSFNGQEKDDEISGVTGANLSFNYRIYDSRLGRFLSVDPLSYEYPWNSTYAFAENDVIRCIDVEGAEKLIKINYYSGSTLYKSMIYVNNVNQSTPGGDIIEYRSSFWANAYQSGMKSTEGCVSFNCKIGESLVDYSGNIITDVHNMKYGVNWNSNKIQEITAQEEQYSSSLKPGGEPATIWVKQSIATFFDTDQASLQNLKTNISDDAKTMVKDMINIMKEESNITLTITGHTDIRLTDYEGTEGILTEENNVTLSKDRAEAYKQYFIETATSMGVTIDPSRISTTGVGSSESNQSATTEAEYQEDRYADFEFSTP